MSMGAPRHLRPADVDALRHAAEPDVSVTRHRAADGRVEWSALVEPHGVTLLEVSRERR
jgi:hypothetical protein